MTALTKAKKTAPLSFFDLSYQNSTNVRFAYSELDKKVVISFQSNGQWIFKTIDPTSFAGVTFGDRSLRFAFGDGRDNRIEASTGARMIFAGGGNDTIVATAGDFIDGGSGADRVVIDGEINDYTGSWTLDGRYVLTNKTTHKAITLRNVERVIFKNGAVNTASTASRSRQSTSETLVLGTNQSDTLSFNLMVAGSSVIDGGAWTDTVYFQLPNSDPEWSTYSISLNSDGQLVLANSLYHSTVTLINIERIVQMPQENDWYTTNIHIGTAANDTITDPDGSIIFSGAGDDSVTGGEDNYFINLGDGNDTFVDTKSETKISVIGSLGNDYYYVDDFDLIDYSDISSIIANLDFSIAANSQYSTTIIRKFSSLLPGAQNSLGTDMIYSMGSFGTLITGDGNDQITVNNFNDNSLWIDAGGGQNTITINNAPGSSSDSSVLIFLANGANTISSAAKLDLYFTSVRGSFQFGSGQGYSVDLSQGLSHYYGGGASSPITSTWNTSANGWFHFHENNCEDTVVGTDNDDNVSLGSGDQATLAGGNDEVWIIGDATADGGSGYDTAHFYLPQSWNNDLSPGQTRETVTFTLTTSADSTPSTATWNRFKADHTADGTIVSQISGFEHYVIEVADIGETEIHTNHDNVLTDINIKGSTRSERFELIGLQQLNNTPIVTITGGGGNDVFEFADCPSFTPDKTTVVNITDFDASGTGKDRIDLTSLVEAERDIGDGSTYFIYVELNGNMATIRTTDDNGNGSLIIKGGSHFFTLNDFITPSNSNIRFTRSW